MKKLRIHVVIAILLCATMAVGSTLAWFTDVASSNDNIIQSGKLDVELYWSTSLDNEWIDTAEAKNEKIFNYQYWEPGYTVVRYFHIKNAGNLAFKFNLQLQSNKEDGELSKLAEVIDVYYIENPDGNITSRRDLVNMTPVGTLKQVIDGTATAEGHLLAGEFVTAAVALKMQESAGNKYQGLSEGNTFNVLLTATQYTYEEDSFDKEYDAEATLPAGSVSGSINASASAEVTVVDGKTSGDVTISDGNVSAEIPAGVSVADGTTELTLSVNTKGSSDANITLGENETLQSVDVHVEGVAEGNTVPMEIKIAGFTDKGLNMGNLKLYHVEDGVSKEMTYVASDADFTAHNQFKYDPDTGDVILYMASFSEVAAVADTVNAWNGDIDVSWYNPDSTSFVISNADRLAGFGAIVGGMAKDDDGNVIQDSFSGKTVKLISNINIGDTNSENGIVFYPIGYYSSDGTYEKNGTAITSGFKTFEGTFDGNGHTISNFYQNTWEMKGDHNWYDASLQYYRDGMGLFGKVYGGTVKNLTVSNFSSDGEITTTGVIAAYADCGATFENIAIFNCNPRVYNIGNGGIVGCVGWYANDAHTDPVTFKNITVDNTNKISALWGSWDVACGGIVGQYYPTSGQESAIDNAGVHFENCHVAAQIDVYNDVCANYQYYAYRYAGMMIGSVRENVEQDGHVYPKMDGITASGCTVHFGDWNDYYYCELVANSLASYTHDHQMSRLEQVAAVNGTSITYLNGTTGTVPSTGRYNYVVVKAKDDNGMWIHGDGTTYATCYHFVDGAVWNHADAGKETVDGVEVLKEDKQLVYREFYQLVTGYGWGVTSKGIGDMEGVKILDREEGNSVVKFEKVDTALSEYRAGTRVTVGQLFKAIDNLLVPINANNVQVTVSPADDESTAGCIYTANATNWANGLIEFTGKGAATVTINDYYFCTSTTISLDVVGVQVTGVSVKLNKHVYDSSNAETFSNNDITVTAIFNDGSAKIVNDFTVDWGNDSDFSQFGFHTGTLSYTYGGDTVTTTFQVTVVNAQPKTVSEGSGAERLFSRYFEMFGINGIGQNYYQKPDGTGAVGYDYGTQTRDFGNGTTVTYYAGNNFGNATYTASNETTGTGDAAGQLTINCTEIPGISLFGYVGYAEGNPIAFGVYVDTIDNMQVQLPSSTDNGTGEAAKLTGAPAAAYFNLLLYPNQYNVTSGTHTIHFVSIFSDGIAPLTSWTINIAEKAEEDISTKTANVIILAGQSNAYGATPLTEPVRNQLASVDFSNIFIHYSNINCDENGLWKSFGANAHFEQYHAGIGGPNEYTFGPELGVAWYLATTEATKDEVWYIVKYTAASTMLDGQWMEGQWDNNGLISDMGGHLSDLMLSYIDSSLAEIISIHGADKINIRSFMWMQGESDAIAATYANNYQRLEKDLVNKLRTKYAAYTTGTNGSGIVFVDGAIAAHSSINAWAEAATVNSAKKANTAIWYPPHTGIPENNPSPALTNSVGIDTSSLFAQQTCRANVQSGAYGDTGTDLFHKVWCGLASGEDGAHYCTYSMFYLGQQFGFATAYLNGMLS